MPRIPSIYPGPQGLPLVIKIVVEYRTKVVDQEIFRVFHSSSALPHTA